MLSVRDVDRMNSSVEHKAATALVIEMTNFEKSPPTSIKILFPSSHNPRFYSAPKKKLALKGNRGDRALLALYIDWNGIGMMIVIMIKGMFI